MQITSDMTGMLTTIALGAHLNNQQRQMHGAVDQSNRAINTLNDAMIALRQERARNAALVTALERARAQIAALEFLLDDAQDD